MRFADIFKIGRSGILRNIISAFIVLSIFPTILVTIFADGIYSRNISKQSSLLTERSLSQHATIVNERMKACKRIFYELLTSADFIRLSSEVNVREGSTFSVDKAALKTRLEQSTYTSEFIRGCLFISDTTEAVTYSKWYDGSWSMIWDNKQWREEQIKQIRKYDELYISTAVNFLTEFPQDDYVVFIGMPVRNLRTNERSGVLLIALDSNIFRFESDAKNFKIIDTVVTNSEEIIISTMDNSFIGVNFDEYLSKKYRNGNIYFKSVKVEETPWVITMIIDSNIQKREMVEFRAIIIMLMIIITSVFFVILYRLSSHYVSEIQELVRAIKRYDGNEMEQMHVHFRKDDELYAISHQFNQMVNRINQLVKALYKKNVEIKAAMEREKHAEIKALEAQINPHFLYNTLDSINWRAIDAGEEEISNMLGMLGSLLRYSVSNIDIIIPLQVEVEWLKKYIFFQRDRFGNSFECRYNITEDALGFPVYKMLLQPIVENCILHGFAETKSGGIIQVNGFVREDGRLEISISDNGGGMAKATLDNIKKYIAQKNGLDSDSIGVSNVINRMYLYYRDAGFIDVESRLLEGTKVTLIIPSRKGGSDYCENNHNCRG